MKSFNLKKVASKDIPTTHEKMIEEHREKMDMCVDAQGIDGKNINLSMPIKNKDSNVPFNLQLEGSRKNETNSQIIESKMDKKEANIKDRKTQIIPINIESQKYDDKKTEAFKKSEEKNKIETEFWDKFVGKQIEDEKTVVDGNIPSTASQLPNNENRFKGEEIKKQVMASLKDADAMLFHIYATAEKNNRDLSDMEKQQIIDINSGKMRLVSSIGDNLKVSENFSQDPKIVRNKNNGNFSVIEQDGSLCADGYKSCRDAKIDYPEADDNSE